MTCVFGVYVKEDCEFVECILDCGFCSAMPSHGVSRIGQLLFVSAATKTQDIDAT